MHAIRHCIEDAQNEGITSIRSTFARFYPKQSPFTSSNDHEENMCTTTEAEAAAAAKKPNPRMRETVRDVNVSLITKGIPMQDVKIDGVYLWEVEHLGKKFPTSAPEGFMNTMGGTAYIPEAKPQEGAKLGNANLRMSTFIADDAVSFDLLAAADATEYNKLIGESECVLSDVVRKVGSKTTTRAYVRAGPRRNLHFYPEGVNAAIVTCGGLCPGLNNVIREITRTLLTMYGIKGKIWGIRGGYQVSFACGFDLALY